MSKDFINLTDYILKRAYGKSDSYTRGEIDALLSLIKDPDLNLFEVGR